MAGLDGEYWLAALAARFHGLTARPGGAHPEQDPMGRLRSIGLDDISVHRIWGTQQTLVRTAQAARREQRDQLKVCLMVQGTMTIAQSGAEVTVGPGEFALYDTDKPYRLTNHGPWQVSVMTVARRDLSLSPQRLARLMHQPIVASSGPGRLYASYLADIVSVPDPAQLATTHIRTAGIALLSAALTQIVDRAIEVSPDVVAEQLVRYIKANIDDSRLSVEGVAARHHMSARSVQRLLAAQDLTFSSLVREERLRAIRRDLADRTLAHRPIAAVAARWGVVDQPWLSRSFRAAFGLSPSTFRRQALNPASAGLL